MKTLKKEISPELAAIDAAMQRAARSAHALARRTKTPCYIWKDGVIVDLNEQRKSGRRKSIGSSGKTQK
jgi:hypothetical protein